MLSRSPQALGSSDRPETSESSSGLEHCCSCSEGRPGYVGAVLPSDLRPGLTLCLLFRFGLSRSAAPPSLLQEVPRQQWGEGGGAPDDPTQLLRGPGPLGATSPFPGGGSSSTPSPITGGLNVRPLCIPPPPGTAHSQTPSIRSRQVGLERLVLVG